VAAILEATIRVLGSDGAALTTTRVAEVAGVSVGTLYQYFPNRDALLNGVLAEHLEHAVVAVEAEVERVRALPLVDAGPRVIRAFIAAKAERAAVSRVLHMVIDMIDDRPAVIAATRRAERAVATLLPGADPLPRAAVMCAALEGVVRAAIVEDPARLGDPAWVDRVVALAAGAIVSA
jgi:AcrR family transcriptional regulator